ncbi:protein HEAT INTOLERANT 4-like [Rutidosis leptorrhynchoides]|uniref:protein HEAT INTOLERANT 4-like n=1 Tax=Rutidosis leptorrhynchoides TaxID=125765 RepID=UPI003A994D15
MVPVILAVESPTPPSDKVAVEYKSSMECFEEKIVHTNDLNFGWIPYNIPTAESHESPRIFMLSCEDREILGQLKSQGVTSCTPYILNPLREDDTEQNTFVRIQYPPVSWFL